LSYYKKTGTDDTPDILMDADLSVFQMIGNSTPEDVNKIYDPVISWLNTDGAHINNCQCKMFFRYLSSASHHKVFNILNKLNELYLNNRKLTVEWAYEKIDDDMLRLGLDFASILDIPFEFSPRN